MDRKVEEKVTNSASIYHLIEFILITGAALGVARYVRAIPAIVFEIVFGIVFGAAVFSITTKDFGIELLSNVGLFAIFFQVGLDFDLTAPELTSSTPARSAVAGVVASAILVFLAALALGNPTRQAVLVGLATVSTSVSVAVYSFLTMGPLTHLEGKVAVLAGLFDDLLGLTALAVLSSILSHSLGGLISLFVSLVVVVVSYVLKRRLAGKSFELHMIPRYGLVLTLMGAMILLWARFGLTLAIAGFVAGAFSGPVLSRSDQKSLMALSAVVGPFFLVSLGLLVKLDNGVTWADLLGVVVLSLALVAAKWANSLAVGKQVKDRVLYWFSMVPRAEVAGIGLILIAPQVSASLELQAVLAVVATSVAAPFVITHRARRSA